MKKIVFILLLAALCTLLTLSASAFTVEIKDEIGLLGLGDGTMLTLNRDAKTEELLNGTRFGVLTYAAQYLDDYPSNTKVQSKFLIGDDSAVILVLRYLNGDYYYDMYLYGEANDIFKDADVDAVLDGTGVYSNLKSGRFEEGIRNFFSLSADVLQKHHEKQAARQERAPLVSIAVGVLTALLVGGGSMLGVWLYYRRKCHGETYPLDRYARLNLTQREDRFVGSFVTRTRIPKNKGSSGGSRGGGGRRGGR